MGAAVVSRQLSSVSASIKELSLSRPLGGREVWMIPKQKTIGSDVGIQRQILSRSQIYAAISPVTPFLQAIAKNPTIRTMHEYGGRSLTEIQELAGGSLG